MGKKGEVKIAGLGFPVEKAVLCGQVFPNGFNWSLKISTVERELLEEMVGPFVYAECIKALRNRKISRWTDIIGQKVSWEQCYDEETGDRQAGICLWTHEDINEATLEFFRNGEGLFVKWDGLAELDLDELCEERGAPLSIETPVEFRGFVVHRIPEDQALEELRKWVTGETFKEPVKQQDNCLLFEVADR